MEPWRTGARVVAARDDRPDAPAPLRRRSAGRRRAAPAPASALAPDAARLLAEVAHDLRSPLTSILFLAETLTSGRSGPLTELQRRQLGLIYSAALGLSELASDALDLARHRSRLDDPWPTPFSVAEVFESVERIVRPMAEEKGLEVRTVRPSRDLRLGRPAPLSRILLNLTTNALKFTDAGHVELSAVPAGADELEFSVRDTGRGIPDAALERLWDPFRPAVRDGRTRDVFSSTGLGLAICRRLVDSLEGRLDVETGVGRGTRFHFTLRLPAAEDRS